MPVDRKALRDAIVAEDDRTMRPKPKAAQPEPLPERKRPRGLGEMGNMSDAEVRSMHRMADGGTPRTDMASQPKMKSAQEMLESYQRRK